MDGYYKRFEPMIQTGVVCIAIEEIISKYDHYSYFYAKYVLKGRFELGEEVIIKKEHYLYYYCQDIVQGRFGQGEKALSKNIYCSYHYATKISNCRFKLAELKIAQSGYMREYCKILLKYNHE